MVGNCQSTGTTGTMTRDPAWVKADLASWTYSWLIAAERQAERVATTDFRDSEVEILLFADALRNVMRGAEALLDKNHDALKAFRDAVPHAVKIRDMLEHFDEYVQGTGYMQKGSQVEKSWLVCFSGSESGGVGKRRVHIGVYELDVASAHQAASELAAVAIPATEYQLSITKPVLGE